ncbi:hypothetical protein NQ318_003603 [Aromia moschata]|uniref:PH domain-containing protein n=1 Tax=Aromia moschata TaxID=1265417 RepID=A0AAV8YXK9_9CUCU|nr:hypothetical protein NQ318_003603 [Aromia moschata]
MDLQVLTLKNSDPLQVASWVKTLQKSFTNVLSYGYLGDVAYHSDKAPLDGATPIRLFRFQKLLWNRGYQGEIAIYSESSDMQIDV